MSDQEFKRAWDYANAALALIKRSHIPAYPQFYELLYTYVTGINPPLNARLNQLLQSGQTPTTDVAETLYNEFLRAGDVNERMNAVSEQMTARIDAVTEAIDSAMTTATSYSGSLEAASGALDRDMSGGDIKLMALRLLAETRAMQQTNRHLEQQLEASREGISALQRDLDDVRREALLDPLTKISNRKCFDQGLSKAVLAATESGEPLCLVMVDIDRFKHFNDTYGHQTGDQVLRLVALTLKANIKRNDMAARYGGEEFAVVLPVADIDSAVALAEKIRLAIHGKELLKRSTNEKLGRITASFGVAELLPNDTTASLIERADRCLYLAKELGRNRVVSERELASSRAA